MPRRPNAWIPALVMLAAGAGACAAQDTDREPLYDPAQLPEFHGGLQLFTLTPVGDVDGFIMTDGTEVKTPPDLTAKLTAVVAPGDRITIHGLKAVSRPLIQAMSVTNDATHARWVDAGPDRALRPLTVPPARPASRPVSVEGTIRMLLHGPRGDVNGALLDDGTILKLPPPEAERLAPLLVARATLRAEGRRRTTPLGMVVDLTALGPANGPLQQIAGAPPPGGEPPR